MASKGTFSVVACVWLSLFASATYAAPSLNLRGDTEKALMQNSRPVAIGSVDGSSHVQAPFALYGQYSRDPDGDPLTYRWSVTSAPSGSTAELEWANNPVAVFTPDLVGLYVFQLVVSDGLLDSDPAILQVPIIAVRGPEVFIDSPSLSGSNLFNSTPVVVRGHLSEPGTLWVQGTSVQIDADNRFVHEVHLEEGWNMVDFFAENAAGSDGSIYWSGTLDSIPPGAPQSPQISVEGQSNSRLIVRGTADAVEAFVWVNITNLRSSEWIVTQSDGAGGFEAELDGAIGDELSIVAADDADNYSDPVVVSGGS